MAASDALAKCGQVLLAQRLIHALSLVWRAGNRPGRKQNRCLPLAYTELIRWSSGLRSACRFGPMTDHARGCREGKQEMQFISALLMLSLSCQLVVQETGQRPLFGFAAADAGQKWQTVNDGVMGGVSDGRFRITDDRTMEFFGALSLQNNGGFASVRSKPADFSIQPGDVIAVRVKGDGRQYVLNLYTKTRRMAFSYRAPLPTTRGEWTETRVPIEDFIPTAFGRRVQGMGAVPPDQIIGIGFMLSDKQAGPFKLEIASVGVMPAEK